MRKAQAALEFILLLSFMFLIFTGFFAVIQNRLVEIWNNRARQVLLDQTTLIETEFKTATVMADGYQRIIEFPQTINGREYDAKLYVIGNTKELLFKYKDEQYDSSFILPKNIEATVTEPSSAPQYIPLMSITSTSPSKYCLMKKEGKVYLEIDIKRCDYIS